VLKPAFKRQFADIVHANQVGSSKKYQFSSEQVPKMDVEEDGITDQTSTVR
jgi:hypothetical protein